MKIYWIIVLFFLHVEGDFTENSAQCETTRDEDDEYCGAICYPIVKPLLRYAAICQDKDSTISKLKDEIREKDVYIAKLESKLELAKTMDFEANKQVEHLKVQLNLKEMQEHMEALQEQSEARRKSWDQQLKDRETELHLKAIEILRIEKEMKDNNLKMEMQSKDKSIRELEDQVDSLKRTQEASSCLPFTNSNDIHTIRLPGIDPFLVPCNSTVSGSGWTVIQRRVNGKVDFYRNWSDFKQGFGDLREDFFLGLEKIHHMTLAQPHELYIQLGMVNGSTSYARYDDFKVGSEEEGYKLKSVGKYSGTAGDSLTKRHLNMKFSTWDRMQDTQRDHMCVQWHKSGWWFSDCGPSALNAIYYKNGIRLTSQPYGIGWGSWHDYNYKVALTFSQMLIRPKPKTIKH